MDRSRRRFLRDSALLALSGTALGGAASRGAEAAGPPPGTPAGSQTGTGRAPMPGRDALVPDDRFDPWLEIDAGALRHNAREVARISGGRPVTAVIKNNAYGLGLENVAAVLDPLEEVRTLAVVKTDEAHRLLDAGVQTPVLLMALAPPDEESDLVHRGARLAPFTDDAPSRLARLAAGAGGPVPVHQYLDSGMGRLGMPHHRALPWMGELQEGGHVRVEGTFMTFVESDEVDPVQLERFEAVGAEARSRGLETGPLHACSSHGLFHRREALLDMVRPGLVLYGAYPSGGRPTELASLRPAFRLRARVVRVEQLRPGDGVSYGYRYVAERPTWIATLPVGHVDGYPRTAVEGCRVLIGERTYPVVGAVSASHSIVEVGDEPRVAVGDAAVFVGPDHEDVHPNRVAEAAGVSVYDILMRLDPTLPSIGFQGAEGGR